MAKTDKTTAKVAKPTKAANVVQAGDAEIPVDRRTSSDRREKAERRAKDEPVSQDRRRDAERRKTPRRRQIDPTTCERDYSDAEIEFMQAMDDYKRANGRMFPTCSEILEVLQKLGYEKVVPASEESASDSVALADDASANGPVPADPESSNSFDEMGVDPVELEQPPADEEI